VNARAALPFVRRHGIVLESARGPAPSFAEAVAGERIRGSWWGHPKSHEIFWLTRAVRDSPDVLVCRLVDGKITYVHRRVWPALVRLASELGRDRLAAIREIHTASGKHIVKITEFPDWVPRAVASAGRRLTPTSARAMLRTKAGVATGKAAARARAKR
jgi:hypothetical protein